MERTAEMVELEQASANLRERAIAEYRRRLMEYAEPIWFGRDDVLLEVFVPREDLVAHVSVVWEYTVARVGDAALARYVLLLATDLDEILAIHAALRARRADITDALFLAYALSSRRDVGSCVLRFDRHTRRPYLAVHMV